MSPVRPRLFKFILGLIRGHLLRDRRGRNQSAPQTVQYTVNTAPVLADETATTAEDTPVSVTLLATDADGDTLVYSIVSGPSNGTAVMAGNVLTYTPALNFHGTDTMQVEVSDGRGARRRQRSRSS